MTGEGALEIEPVSRTFASQGLKLHYLDWGDPAGPLILLLHGSRDHARSWDWTARALVRDGWRVVAPDLRGHGDSDWSPDGAYIVSYNVLDLADLIDHLGAPQLTLVGHSFGGVICARYTAMFPERVRKLVIVDGMGPGPGVFRAWERQGSIARSREWVARRRTVGDRPPLVFATVEDALARMAAGNLHLTPEQAEHLGRHAVRRTDGGWTWKSDPLVLVFPPEDFAAEASGVWSGIACPTLIFWGAKSYLANPLADGRVEQIPQARTVVYDDAGHWLHHERFDDFLAELRAFV
jgi:pimeloyl-ACP methyl ester carboxylesterase